MIYPVYTAAFAAAMTAYVPLAVGRRLRRGVPLHVRERLGFGHHGRGAPGRQGWVHAVSVGETMAAAPIVNGLRRLYPALPLVVTTVTETGARVARERFAGTATHRFFPLDLPGATRRVIASIDPAFVICMETEIWPNMLRALAARGVPVMIANGRLSDRSYRRYRLIRRWLRPVLAQVRVFGMQSDEDARRMITLGAPPERVVVTGNVKHEAAADVSGAAELWQRLLRIAPDAPVWIAGSTHRGEEEAALEAHRALRREFPALRLVLAPRHPERVPEVLSLILARGFAFVRRSELPRQHDPDAVIVLDTVGELAQLYAIADVVFVGGSLVPSGGHNMLEAALRGKPALFGPHTTNFREPAALLTSRGGGLVVEDVTALQRELRRLLGDADLRARMGAAGHAAVAERHGAVRETLELVGRFLYPGGPV
ncbi:MAG: 3-deoxy-D-manno-octulosonic acid transferase [Candidatus Rokuibacteriota bacterium]